MTTIHVNPFHVNASDANSGTIEDPLLTFTRSLELVQPGDVIYIERTTLTGQYSINVPNTEIFFNGSLFQGADDINLNRITGDGTHYQFDLLPGEYVPQRSRPNWVPESRVVPQSYLNNAGIMVDGVLFTQVYIDDAPLPGTFYQAETFIEFYPFAPITRNTRVMLLKRPFALVLNASGVTIHDCTFNGYTGVKDGIVRSALEVFGDNVRLLNVSTFNSYRGMYLSGKDTYAENLKAVNCGLEGIFIDDGPVMVDGLTLHDNGSRTTPENFFQFQGGSKVINTSLTVNAANVKTAYATGMWADFADTLTVRNSLVRDCLGMGIFAESTGTLVVENSDIEHCNLTNDYRLGGISLATVNIARINDNSFIDNTNVAISFLDRDGSNVQWGTVTINDNTIDGEPFKNMTKTGPEIISSGNRTCKTGSIE